jgi:hypothetical protein
LFPIVTDAVEGAAESEANAAAATVNVAEPLIVPDLAVMVALPGATLVTNPPLPAVAIDVADEVQLAVLVRLCVVPSL